MRQSDIEGLFPAVYRASIGEEGPLRALVAVMETMHELPERELDNFEATLHPRRTRDAFVPMLARWVDLAWLWTEARDASAGASGRPVLLEHVGLLRELVASAAELSQWRGTARGLVAFLRRATGLDEIELVESPPSETGEQQPFHVQVVLPHRANRPRLHALVTRIIEMEKPAHLTYEIVFANPTRS